VNVIPGKGIAFEFAIEPDGHSACVAIMVHLPGQRPAMILKDVNELLKKGVGR
jgi:hypothetical protein